MPGGKLTRAASQTSLKIFAEKNVPVFWVGMPIMENQRLSTDMLALNEIVRNAVKNAGATYVDLWEPFADDQNRYSPIGPDLNGDTVRLRTADGVHFTKLGARKAAHFVELEIKRAMDRQPPPQAAIALPSIPTTPPPPTPPSAREASNASSTRSPAAGSTASRSPNLSLPVKPLAGPILPLNGVEVNARAPSFWAVRPARTRSMPRRLVERVLVQGHAPDPKAGRADDFRWPLALPLSC